MTFSAVNARVAAARDARMNPVPGLLLTTALAVGAMTDLHAEGGKLDIVATAATATISPGGTGRRTVALPSLSYSFQLLHECASSFEPQSLSLTIADSHRFLGGAALGEANGVTRLDMDIPAGQLPPIILSDFCSADTTPGELEAPGLKTVSALLSAAASLKCANEDTGERTIYSMAPLDVVLVCARSGETGADGTSANE